MQFGKRQGDWQTNLLLVTVRVEGHYVAQDRQKDVSGIARTYFKK